MEKGNYFRLSNTIAATKHSVRPFVYHDVIDYNHDMWVVNDNDGRRVCLTLESGVERRKSNTPVF